MGLVRVHIHTHRKKKAYQDTESRGPCFKPGKQWECPPNNGTVQQVRRTFLTPPSHAVTQPMLHKGDSPGGHSIALLPGMLLPVYMAPAGGGPPVASVLLEGRGGTFSNMFIFSRLGFNSLVEGTCD